MTGTDPGPWQISGKKRPCLFAVNDSPLTFCDQESVEGKVFCKKHIGKKQYQEAKS